MAESIAALVKHALKTADFDLSDPMALRLAANLFSKNPDTRKRFQAILNGTIAATPRDIERLIYLLEQITHRTWTYDGQLLQAATDDSGSHLHLAKVNQAKANKVRSPDAEQINLRQILDVLQQISTQQAANAQAIAENAKTIAELKTLQTQTQATLTHHLETLVTALKQQTHQNHELKAELHTLKAEQAEITVLMQQ